jgi:hypothetical protein
MRPNRPHIPSFSRNVKERSSDKKRAMRQFLGVSLRALSSDFPKLSFGFRLRSASSPSRIRFGEGVFTDPRRWLQEGKERSSQKFCSDQKLPQNLGVGARNGTSHRYKRQ